MIQSEPEHDLNIRPIGLYMITFLGAVLTASAFFIYISVGQNTIENTQKRIDINRRIMNKIDSVKNAKNRRSDGKKDNIFHGQTLQ